MAKMIDNEQIIAVCEKCDSNIYGNEMYVMDKRDIVLCMDCAKGISQDIQKGKEN